MHLTCTISEWLVCCAAWKLKSQGWWTVVWWGDLIYWSGLTVVVCSDGLIWWSGLTMVCRDIQMWWSDLGSDMMD